MIAGAALLGLLILIIDLSFPLGIAGGVPYVALVCLGWLFRRPRDIVALGAASSLLTLLGYFLSPEGGVPWVVPANRLLALFAIWVVATFLVIAKRAGKALREDRESLERHVGERTAEIRRDLASLALAFQPARIRAWTWSADTRQTRYLPSHEHVRDSRGQPAKEATFGETQLLQAHHPDDRTRVAEVWGQAHADHRPYAIDYRLLLPDGEVRHNHEIGIPEFDEFGRYLGHFGTTQDITERERAEWAVRETHDTLEQRVRERTVELEREITERKRAEGALRQSEERLTQATRLAGLGYLVWDSIADRCLHCSEDYARTHGTTVEDYLARASAIDGAWSFTHPGDRETYKAAVEELRRGKGFELEYRVVTPEGETRHVRETVEPVFDDDGQVVQEYATIQDITGRKQAEAALRQSEEQFRNLIDGSIQGVLIHRGGKPLFANQAFADTFGYDGPEEIVALPSIAALEAEHERGRLAAYGVARLRDGEAPARCVFEGVRKEGGRVWLEDLVTVVAWDGEPAIQSTTVAVTRRMRAETALRESEAALTRAQRQARIGSWRWSVERNELVSCSEEYARLHGVGPDEIHDLMARQLERVVHPDDRERVAAAFKRVDREGADYEIEYRIVRPDGEVRHVLEIGEAVLDEAGHAVEQTGTIQDITERVQTREELARSEAQLRLVTDSLPVLIAYLDRDERFRFVNRTSTLWHGRSAEDMLGTPTKEILNDAYERIRPHIEAVLSGQSVTFEERVAFADGVTRDVRVSYLPHFDRNHKVQGFFALTEDMTEPKRAQDALIASERVLHERVIELEQAQIILKHQREGLTRFAEELKTARDEAEAANRAKSEFLAAMSHELRTPLNSVIGFSEIMKDHRLGRPNSDRYRGYAADIHASGQHLLKLINDILDLSKIEFGAEALHEEVIEVPNLFRFVELVVRERAERGGVELELDVRDDLPPLRADERKLKQILVNLLANAVKFTEPGGRATLKAWSGPDSGFVFQVVDSGIGIAPEDIPKALSQFGQVDGDLNRRYEGTGLGLPLSKSLVELHGGSLDLQSEVGTGTTVTVRFPAARIVEAADGTRARHHEERAAS